MKEELTKFHALQLFTDTWAAETLHLTMEKRGIYISLICFSWTKNAVGITLEQAYQICLCRTDECKKNVQQVLTEFFKILTKNDKGETVYQNKRLLKEHEYLINKYKKKSISGSKGAEIRWNKNTTANGKDIAPIPKPIPIPKININDLFDSFWKSIKYKKGSRFLAFQRYQKYCTEIEPSELANKYNKYASSVKDKQFQKHVSTWINQKCFEDEEETKSEFALEEKLTFEYNGKILRKIGETGFYYDLIDDDGNKFKKHKFAKEPITAN